MTVSHVMLGRLALVATFAVVICFGVMEVTSLRPYAGWMLFGSLPVLAPLWRKVYRMERAASMAIQR